MRLIDEDAESVNLGSTISISNSLLNSWNVKKSGNDIDSEVIMKLGAFKYLKQECIICGIIILSLLVSYFRRRN